MRIFDPILSNAEAADFEKKFFDAGIRTQREIIKEVGVKMAREFSAEFPAKRRLRLLAALGSGHNAADALAFIAALAKSAQTEIALVMPPAEKLKPLTREFFDALKNFPLEIIDCRRAAETRWDIAVEGLSGMSYAPPMREKMREEIEMLNEIDADIKISVDIPAGLSDSPAGNDPIFRADLTYATAIAKKCIFARENKKYCGRIRYIDTGFFGSPLVFGESACTAAQKIAVPDALSILSRPRISNTDKRSYGKLLIVSGSQKYAGAAMLNASAAIRSGCGFVFSCIPEDFKPAFCAKEPSVIWHGCTVGDSGEIALENFTQINALAQNATALLCGSGLTNSRESAALVSELLKANPDLPCVLDADAITPEILQCLKVRKAPAAITPHEGEFLRITPDASDASLIEAARKYSATIVLKSNITRICDGESIAYSTRGSPALSRAGSGDILSALIGGLLANDSLKSAFSDKSRIPQAICAMAAQWLGLAAEKAAAERSETALATSDIINYLPAAL